MNYLTNYEGWLHLNKRETTAKTYLGEVRMFAEWWEGVYGKPFTPSEVISLDTSDYKQYLMTVAKGKQGKRLSMITVNKKIEALRNYFTYLVEEEKSIPKNPIEHLKTQRIHTATMADPRWLDRNEKNRFLRTIEIIGEKKAKQKIRNKAICFLMLKAGLRISEVVSLRLDDMELERGVLTVQDGKGGKMRKVTINKDVVKAIQDWLDIRGEQPTDAVFVSQKRTPITVQGIEDFFGKLKVEANIEELTPHVLRHTFCHDLIEKGYSISLVADMAGHADLNTTRIYTRSSEEERRKAAESLSANS
jgi:integrase/recombinase XerD